VIPRPPFAWELTEAQEVAAFEALKPRLAPLWNAIFTADDQPYTSVIVPSMTLHRAELEKLPGATFYEERLLFLLIRLRNPRARMVYLTSQPVHPMVLEYYLQFLSGVPASHARTRLTILSAHDGSPRPLTEKILERPRLVQRIRASIMDPARAYLTVFNATPLERKLAVLLGIPMNGLDPKLCQLGTKSGSRKVFRESGVPLPAGFEDLRTEEDLETALAELQRMRPGLRRAVVKLNEGFSGEGNAIVELPIAPRPEGIRRSLHEMRFSVPSESTESFLAKLSTMGGVVEELVEAPESTSPSAQLRVNPSGEAILISTHDQVLGGNSGQVYLGCRFPAASGYRTVVQDAGMRIGAVLASKGVVSRFGVDFLATRQGSARRGRCTPWRSTSHGRHHPPFLALRFLIDGGTLIRRPGCSGLRRARRSSTAPPIRCGRTPTGLTPRSSSTSSPCTGCTTTRRRAGACSSTCSGRSPSSGSGAHRHRQHPRGRRGPLPPHAGDAEPGVAAGACAGGAGPDRRGAGVSFVDPSLRREIFGWYSPRMGMDMPIVRYGGWGRALLLFPTAGGDFLEAERMWLIMAIEPLLVAGRVTVFGIDSVNRHAWMADGVPLPRRRGGRHCTRPTSRRRSSPHPAGAAERFGPHRGGRRELRRVPRGQRRVPPAGSVRHADRHERLHDLGPGYLFGFGNDDVYFNNPTSYLLGLNGTCSICSTTARCTSAAARARGTAGLLAAAQRHPRQQGRPHQLDLWGHDTHDWPTWRKMLPYALAERVGW
jgi:esterase/lipase superfamily enzyme